MQMQILPMQRSLIQTLNALKLYGKVTGKLLAKSLTIQLREPLSEDFLQSQLLVPAFPSLAGLVMYLKGKCKESNMICF